MFRNWVLTNPNASIIAFLLGGAGIVVAIVIAAIQRTRKQLEYHYYTVEIINPLSLNAKDLEILYKKQPIKQLSVTRCDIINTGNSYIEYAQDVYDSHPICIKMSEGVDILSAELVYVSDDVIIQNNASLEVKDNKVQLFFDTIERNKYMSINLYHTGTEKSHLKVIGRLRGGDIRPHVATMRFKVGVTIIFIILEYSFVDKYLTGDGNKWHQIVFAVLYAIFYYMIMSGRILFNRRRSREELLNKIAEKEND